MRMGNFMWVGPIGTLVMAAMDSRVGISHVTVVPTNFDPDLDAEAETASDEESN